MKAALLFTLLVGSALAAPSVEIKDSRIFEDLIVSVLECVRGIGITGLPEYDIPSFAPLELDELDVDLGILGIAGVSGQVQVSDLTFSGIVEFVITYVSGSIGLIPPSYSIAVSLLIPNPALTTNYALELRSDNTDYELNGQGSLSFDCQDFTIAVSFRLRLLSGISVDRISAPIALGGCSTVEITGVRGDEEYSSVISQQAQENAALWISLASPRFEEILADVVTSLVNGVGEGGTSGGVLEAIFGNCF